MKYVWDGFVMHVYMVHHSTRLHFRPENRNSVLGISYNKLKIVSQAVGHLIVYDTKEIYVASTVCVALKFLCIDRAHYQKINNYFIIHYAHNAVIGKIIIIF